MTILSQSIYANDYKDELEELLIKNLPKRIKGGDTKEGSNIFELPTIYALKNCSFIHYNSTEQISFMLFDLDHINDKTAIEVFPEIEDCLTYIIDKIGLEPTFITQTTKGYQFAYHLKNHIFTKQKKAASYLSNIKNSIIERLGCDIHGSSRNTGIWRNPLQHKHYFSTCFNYELNDFKSLILPQKSIQKQFKNDVLNRQIDKGMLIEGNRNNALFLLGMKFAKNKKNLTLAYLKHYLNTVSITMPKQLAKKEISSIAKSIFNNYYIKDKIFVKSLNEKRPINEGIMGFSKIKNLSKEEYDKEVKRRQSLAAKRTNELLKDKKANLKKAREVYKTKTFATNMQKIREANETLKSKNEKVNISNLVRLTGLNRKTVSKYKKLLI